MSSKKKDLEIIYNLQWKNKSANGGDKANVIGMYDIPATTLKWEVFKSYLLKNAGMVGEDIKVSYIADSNTEFPIETQTDFQIALYVFRRKARMGEIVNLKLDRIPAQAIKKERHSTDAETQFDHNESVSLSSTCCTASDTPPEWFISYMKQFKKTITDEITSAVTGAVANIKPQVVSQQTCYHSRKAKTDCSKRIRRLQPLVVDTSHETKDLLKSLKIEGKLERKLEKLEHKTKKIKERKLALFTKSSDSDVGQGRSSSSVRPKPQEDALEDEDLQMDADPVGFQHNTPHMFGGEVYLHKWQVKNTGKLPWSAKTNLTYTWGSKALSPVEKSVPVPHLKPGEEGTIAARLMVPRTPGKYECYWHFTHKGRRFGHWLGLEVIVDKKEQYQEPARTQAHYKSENFTGQGTSNPLPFGQFIEVTGLPPTVTFPDASFKFSYELDETCSSFSKPCLSSFDGEVKHDQHVLDKFVRDLGTRVEDLKMHHDPPTDTNCSSDTDNNSVVSATDSHSSKGAHDEFVVVPIPDCFKVEKRQTTPVAETLAEPGFKIQRKSSQIDENTEKPNFIEVKKLRPLQCDRSAGKAIVAELMNVEDKALNQDAGEENAEEKGNNDLVVDAAAENFDNNNNSDEADQNYSNQGSSDSDNLSKKSSKSDIVIISMSGDGNSDEYAYVLVDGQKLTIPKMIIKSEYLQNSEVVTKSTENSRGASAASSVEMVNKEDLVKMLDAERPLESYEFNSHSSAVTVHNFGPTEAEDEAKGTSTTETFKSMPSLENNDFNSHCSAVGSCFSEENNNAGTRRFIFPQNVPGYEIIHPLSDQWYSYDETKQETAKRPDAPPLNLSTHDRNPFMESSEIHMPNYPQPQLEAWIPPPPPSAVEQNVVEEAIPAWAQVNPETVTVTTSQSSASSDTSSRRQSVPVATAGTVHILPETLVSGAVNVASSAINTARSVINMIVPQEPGRWVNGHWVSTNPTTPRESNLQVLAEMGFWNRDLNATLLARYNDDLTRVVAELVQ